MPINWSDGEVKDRLLASIIASFEGSINCKEVARIFGGEATYNSIENFLRKPKKLAAQLRAEASGKEAPAASPARAPRTPKKNKEAPLNSVKSGRVTKAKKATGSPIKKEVIYDDENVINNDMSGSEADTEGLVEEDFV